LAFGTKHWNSSALYLLHGFETNSRLPPLPSHIHTSCALEGGRMNQKVLINVILHICHLGLKIGMELASKKHQGMARQDMLPPLPSHIHPSCALTFWKEEG